MKLSIPLPDTEQCISRLRISPPQNEGWSCLTSSRAAAEGMEGWSASSKAARCQVFPEQSLPRISVSGKFTCKVVYLCSHINRAPRLSEVREKWEQGCWLKDCWRSSQKRIHSFMKQAFCKGSCQSVSIYRLPLFVNEQAHNSRPAL